jgi:hypothetical protein
MSGSHDDSMLKLEMLPPREKINSTYLDGYAQTFSTYISYKKLLILAPHIAQCHHARPKE